MSTIFSNLLRWRWHDAKAYEALPASTADLQRPSVGRVYLTRRHIRFVTALTISSVALLWFFGPVKDMVADVKMWATGIDRPPLYESYHQHELHLPQHNPNLPFPEGREGKYLYWRNHGKESGWNNVMQELMLNALVAYASNRSFVFYNYAWRTDGTKYAIYNEHVIPSQIPITALLSGPIGGEPYYTDPNAPRSVGEDYFHEVCPYPKTLTDQELEGKLDRGGSGETMVSQLVELLANEDRCIQVPFMLFDIWIMGDPNRLLDIWPRYASSPILTEFRWSPLIESAFDTNRAFLAPLNSSHPVLATLPPQLPSAARYTPLPGLLALHVRRGDYEQHCVGLADWHADYTAFNTFPAFPDKLNDVVPDDTGGDERRELVRKHCWPSIEEIVRRADEMRETPAGAGLQDVFVLTNGKREWVRDLENAFRDTGRWRTVASSRDLLLSKEQVYVAQAVDMLIGQRAQVFVGNGWSSMSGQINLLRMANGFPPDSSRFL
ncbi:hypothetical protein B0H21DRAFT_229446 [Amylocystis lapponica]|nr:hypothetical protein B0H21DRAFT_229446 [Amylocystis lapponica]